MKNVNFECKIEQLPHIKSCQRSTPVNTTIADAIEMQINTDHFLCVSQTLVVRFHASEAIPSISTKETENSKWKQIELSKQNPNYEL